MTNSLYVKGKLADPDRVIVDVGTGFYLEKVRCSWGLGELSGLILTSWGQDTKSAADFYDDKVKQLASNITDLEAIVQQKTNNLRVVEEGKDTTHPGWAGMRANWWTFTVLRQKVLASPQAAA